MAKNTAPKRLGRPKRKPTPGTRASLGLRVTAETKQRLDDAAEQSGRSQSQEAELRLERTFAAEDRLGGPNMVDLMETIASVMKSTGEIAGFLASGRIMNQGEWMGVPFAFEQARRAAVDILEHHRPPGAIVEPTPNVVEVVGGDGDIAKANERLRQWHDLGKKFAEFELWKKEHDDE